MLYEIKNGTVSLGGNEILSHFYFRMVDGEKIGIVGRNGAGKTTLLKLMNAEIELDYNDDNTMGEIVKSKDFNTGYLRQQLAGSHSSPIREGSGLCSSPIREVLYSSEQRSSELCERGEAVLPTSEKVTVYSYLLEAFGKLIEMEYRIDKLTAELADNYDEKKAVELNTLIDTYNFEGGHIYIKELKSGFKKFGFSEADLERPINEFSGGQSTKISLLKLLLSKPDVLMLDEPTNHLDIEAIEWMENYLQGYKKNIVVVSHDRMFLDNICNVIYDVENKDTVRYDGNYADFVAQKEINYQLKLAEYNKNLKEIERLTALADRFRYKATKAKMVQSKDKVIEKLEAKTFKPIEADTKTFHVKIVPNKVGGKEVLRCTELVVGYGVGSHSSPVQDGSPLQDDSPALRSRELRERLNEIAKVNLIVNRGDRVAVIGANGTGKSTFIKTIVGTLPKISGDYSYGHEIEFEYFDQRIAENSSTKTLFDDFSDEFPTYDNTEVRNRLGRFLFGEEDISKRVCDLSGGEKVRLCLAKIFERKPNLLILDEPTNHLDILGKESLEEIINSFEGTVIFVSHDRYFVKKISNKILFFESRARVARPYDGDRARVARPYDGDRARVARPYDGDRARVARPYDGDRARAARPYDDERVRSAFPYDERALRAFDPMNVVLTSTGDKVVPTNAKFFEFGYDDYEKYVKEKEAMALQNEGDFEIKKGEKQIEKVTDNKLSYKENKQRNKDDKKLKKLEEEIVKLEAELEELNLKLQDESIQSDFEKLSAIQKEIDEMNTAILEKYDVWDKLQ